MKKWMVLMGMLVYGQAMAEINLNLSNSGAQVRATDIVRLRNVNVPGYGNYYVDFKWDATNLVMVPVNLGLEILSQFAVTSTRYASSNGTSSRPASLPDLNQACVQEFGVQYQQADWQDIITALGTDANALQGFKNTISAVSGTYYYVKYGGQASSSDGKVYVLYSNNSGAPCCRLDTIQGDLNVNPLGYNSSGNNAQVVCVKASDTNP